LISLYADGEDLTFHTTNADFIVDAFLACAQGTLVTIHFRDLLDGADCDSRFSWHPHPEHMVLGEGGDDGCDARFSEVEADKATWVEPMTQYCPRQVLVSAVQTLPE